MSLTIISRWPQSILLIAICSIMAFEISLNPAFAKKSRAEIEAEFNEFLKKELEDCVNDEKISPPPPPMRKIDKCEIITGFKSDGSPIPCHKVSDGSCEVQ